MTWAVYLVVFLLALRRALRTPTPAHRDIALFFGASALLIALVYVGPLAHPDAMRIIAILTAAVTMLLPYLLLRVVVGFADAPVWLMPLAIIGMLVSVVALAAAPDPVPPLVLLLVVAYFVGLTAYDTFAFVREAMHSRGVTGRRVQAAAVGSFCLAGAVLLAVIAGLDRDRTELWLVLGRVMSLASAVAYYAGFAPPRWLRQTWQTPDLQTFLTEITRLPYLSSIPNLLAELERHAAAVIGAPSSAIGLWQDSDGVLRYWSQLGLRASEPSFPTELKLTGITTHDRVVDIVPERLITGRAFLEQVPIFSADVLRDDPTNAALYAARNVRAVLAAPITSGDHHLGVLTVWSPRAPIFAESDLELLQLVASQTATVFENRTLLHQVAEARAREQADRSKDSFLASISHDLRNPLTAVGATAQLLRRRLERDGTIEPERLRTSIVSIENSSRQMASLVDQLLDYARLQLDRPLDLNLQLTDLVELVKRVVALHEGTSERHHVRWTISESSLIGSWDQGRLERVLQNLLSNAIKYSPGGGTVDVRLWRESAPGGDFAVVAVRDEGIGIPSGELPLIFDRFHRASNVRGQIAGTGIGLATAQHVIEQHGGSITVESQENQGSTFTVRLPLTTDEA